MATFRVHGNINIRNELRWAELVNSQNLKKYFGLIFKPPGNHLVKLFISKCYAWYLLLCLCSVVICISMSMVADGYRNMSEWIKHLCPLRSTVLLSLRLHFPHPNFNISSRQPRSLQFDMLPYFNPTKNIWENWYHMTPTLTSTLNMVKGNKSSSK